MPRQTAIVLSQVGVFLLLPVRQIPMDRAVLCSCTALFTTKLKAADSISMVAPRIIEAAFRCSRTSVLMQLNYCTL